MLKRILLIIALISVACSAQACGEKSPNNLKLNAPDFPFTLDIPPNWILEFSNNTHDTIIYRYDDKCKKTDDKIYISSIYGMGNSIDNMLFDAAKKLGSNLKKMTQSGEANHNIVRISENQAAVIVNYVDNKTLIAIAYIRVAGEIPSADNYIIFTLKTKDDGDTPKLEEDLKKFVTSFNKLPSNNEHIGELKG